MHAVGELIFTLLSERLPRPPERYNVVVDLLLARNLDQRDLTISPIADRLDPQTWPPFVVRLEVLVDAKITLALQQAKTTWVDVGKGTNLQIQRIGERTP